MDRAEAGFATLSRWMELPARTGPRWMPCCNVDTLTADDDHTGAD